MTQPIQPNHHIDNQPQMSQTNQASSNSSQNSIDDGHFFTFNMNHYMSTPQGKKIADYLKTDFPDIHAKMQQNIALHDHIMKTHFKSGK